ncbi:hypothetical protein M422DRAFT_68108 [Sphaerobolus stellatus SS14]|uniref:Exportin-1/Importin-beta-like domain-containing protein n=1 Tax=Sphaerobolus stellatus (strain SS14) TaxID=990650 RepID=A0A0C9VUH6_SPHS4|nr:hypothetical protein M422DRAFT_68108 [Sphaerobolus stellatus SS14]
MSLSTWFPSLSDNDIQQAITLITESYSGRATIEQQKEYQWNLFEVQKRFAAWGLVAPLLDHPDANVQFFGAHTAQVKIVRDWDSFPKDHAVELKDMLLDLTGKAIISGKSRVIIRKLYVTLVQLAFKLHPTRPSQWPEWVLATIAYFSGRGVSSEQILDFLAIIPEEVRTADFLNATKMVINESLHEAIPTVTQAITTSITNPNVSTSELTVALKCLEKWIVWKLPADYLTPFLPILISLLSFEPSFIPASDVLQEVMTSSSLSDGSGSKVLTEPLLDYFCRHGQAIYEQTIAHGFVDDTAHSFCKLLCALGDHSAMYFASHLSDPQVQAFVRLMLGFTGLPGWFGIDEDESDTCMQFWYLLQESLWAVDYSTTDGADGGWERSEGDVEGKNWEVAAEIYKEVVEVLRRKITWPKREDLSTWTKDQVQKFEGYRRDVGDILINAYYVLKERMLERQVYLLSQTLETVPPVNGWEDIEALLFCIMSVQEVVPIDRKEGRESLRQLFGPTILGKLPSTGTDRVRRTAIQLIGEYSSWFTAQATSALVMDVITYVASGLNEGPLAFRAATAFKDLCDANRTTLAQHIAMFGNLYADMGRIPESEKGKVIQSIASVIQALPPQEAVQPVEAVVSPIVTKLAQAITSASQLPEDARNLCLQELQALTGCARGLTSSSDPLLSFSEDAEEVQMRIMEQARQDPRVVKLRDDMFVALSQAMQLWSTDMELADAFSDLFKAITCIPVDATLISLSPGPLLELVVAAVRRQLHSVWLSLAGMLIGQLDPPSFTTLSMGPTPEAENLVLSALPALLDPCFAFLNSAQAMENVRFFYLSDAYWVF